MTVGGGTGEIGDDSLLENALRGCVRACPSLLTRLPMSLFPGFAHKLPALRVILGGLYSGICRSGDPTTALPCPAGDGPRAFRLTRHHGVSVCVLLNALSL